MSNIYTKSSLQLNFGLRFSRALKAAAALLINKKAPAAVKRQGESQGGRSKNLKIL